jgi:hypothetical protein
VIIVLRFKMEKDEIGRLVVYRFNSDWIGIILNVYFYPKYSKRFNIFWINLSNNKTHISDVAGGSFSWLK